MRASAATEQPACRICVILCASVAGFAAAILAGGSARRFGGVNKAALRFGAARIIDRQLAMLRPLAREIFIVAPDPAPYADLGLRVVPDAIAGAGALGGIYTAIVESAAPRTLVLACDMPFVTAALVTHLDSLDGDLVMPRSARGYEPLCAIYAKACAEPIRRRLERGERHAATLPEGVRVVEVGPEMLAALDEDGLLFANVNTPHDYARARDLFELKPDPTQDRITEQE
jgi:molybdenum cofactor guanylyltransferase